MHFRWLLLLVVTLVMATACATSRRRSNDDDDDGSASGGSGGTSSSNTGSGTGASTSSGTSTSSNTGSTSTGTTSTSTGGTVCDSGVPGDLSNSLGEIDQVCLSCIQCTQQGPCVNEWSPCAQGSNQPCDLYLTCVSNCESSCGTDQTCYDMCVGDPNNPLGGTCMGDYSSGVQQFVTALSCSVCQECPTNCNAAANCGP